MGILPPGKVSPEGASEEPLLSAQCAAALSYPLARDYESVQLPLATGPGRSVTLRRYSPMSPSLIVLTRTL